MANVTGTIGNESVELNNASTEATLLAVLQTLQRQTGLLQNSNRLMTQLGRGGGAGGGAQAGGPATAAASAATNQQTQAQGAAATATNVASKAMGGLSKGALIVGGVLGDLAAGAMKTVGNLTDFAGRLLDGTASVSGLFGAFKDLPLGLGLVAGLFEKLAAMQEQNLTAYRELSKSGINLGGDLNDVRLQALSMGTTLEGFASIMKANSEAFAGMGGSANDGAKNFMNFSKELRNSGTGKTLSALGFSLEEMSQGAANYIKFSGGRTAEEMKNTKGLTAGAGDYLKQLDMLSQITGKSREEQEKLLAEESANAAWQAHLNTLGEEERAKAIAAFNETLQTGGKGAADVLKSKLMGIPPLTEAGQTFMAMATNGTAAIDKVADSVKNQGKTVNDVNKDLAGFRVGLGKDGKALSGPLGASLIAAGGAVGEFASKSIATQTQLDNQGIKSVEDEIAFRKKLAEEQALREKSAAAAAAESEKALKNLGAELMGALMPVFQMLSPIINDLAQQFMGFAKDNMPAIKEALEVFVKYVSNFVKNMFSEDGRAKIVNDLTYYLKLMMIEVKKALLPKIMYSDADAKADKDKLDLEKQSYDKKAEAAQIEMDNSKKLEALKVSKDEKERAKIESEKSKAEADIKKLEDLKSSGTKLDSEQQKQLELAKSTLKKKQEILDLSKNEGAMKEAATAKGTATTLRTQGEAAADAAKGSDITQQADLVDYSATGGLGADKGGIFKGPEAGYMVQLHGHEAVVPMDNTATKSPLDNQGIKSFEDEIANRNKFKDKQKEPIVPKTNLEIMPPMGGMLANQLSASQNIFKDVFSGFTSKLPSLNDIGGSVGSVPPLDKSMLDELNKSFTSFGKTITDRVGISTDTSTAPGSKPEAQQALTIAAITTNGELQTLNNNIKEMLRIVKASYDLERSHLDATRGLQGNLYQ
jgi:hypothetical protein